LNPLPTKILLATDGSEEATLAAQTAVELAAKIGSELHIVHVSPRIVPHYPGYYMGPEVAEHAQQKEQEHLDREAQRLLDTQVEQVRAAGGSMAQAHLRIGRFAEEIVALAEELGVELIVIGSRGRGGVRRAVMGSVSDSVVRHAHCSVLVVRKGKREEVVSILPAKILLASDGSAEANLAAYTAVDLADKTNLELHIVYVQSIPLSVPLSIDPDSDEIAISGATEDIRQEAQWFLNAALKQVKAIDGTIARAHLRIGDKPDQQIITVAEEIGAGLIVLGSRGMGGVRRALLGSVSDSVVRHAHCPVLVVRKEEREKR
jgi:nucleotide-binding universal stress UspA family protein